MKKRNLFKVCFAFDHRMSLQISNCIKIYSSRVDGNETTHDACMFIKIKRENLPTSVKSNTALYYCSPIFSLRFFKKAKLLSNFHQLYRYLCKLHILSSKLKATQVSSLETRTFLKYKNRII